MADTSRGQARSPRRSGRADEDGAGAKRRPRRRGVSGRSARQAAESRLSRFRQGSRLAVGATALLILLAGGAATGAGADIAGVAVAQDMAPATQGDSAAAAAPGEQGADTAADTTGADTVAVQDPAETARQATGTLRDLGRSAYNALPAVGIALAILLVAGVLARLVRMGLRAAFSSWVRADAVAALAAILIWLLALGAALSVVAGDARALFGSIGLFGLALSWALQTPIESFTGWLLNSFRSYYRVGDRIAVGEVFGDVARIDFLTTTVFEAGGPDKQVRAAQSTGALVTFPNSEVLRANVVNYTRDFPYVWDELTVAVANESDMAAAIRVLERVAYEVVGERMEEAARRYETLLERAELAWDVATRPEVYVAARDSWTDLTIRYMVPVREMRKWSTSLLIAVNEALEDPGIAAVVHPGYTRSQVQALPMPGWADTETLSGDQT
jgi:small conductance mechanosensitive channel